MLNGNLNMNLELFKLKYLQNNKAKEIV